MKKNFGKKIAVVLAALLVLSVAAVASIEIVSPTFHLPTIHSRSGEGKTSGQVLEIFAEPEVEELEDGELIVGLEDEPEYTGPVSLVGGVALEEIADVTADMTEDTEAAEVAEGEEVAAETATVYEAGKTMNVFSEASSDSERLGRVRAGDRFIVLENAAKGWKLIRTESGLEGYINLKKLSASDNQAAFDAEEAAGEIAAEVAAEIATGEETVEELLIPEETSEAEEATEAPAEVEEVAEAAEAETVDLIAGETAEGEQAEEQTEEAAEATEIAEVPAETEEPAEAEPVNLIAEEITEVTEEVAEATEEVTEATEEVAEVAEEVEEIAEVTEEVTEVTEEVAEEVEEIAEVAEEVEEIAEVAEEIAEATEEVAEATEEPAEAEQSEEEITETAETAEAIEAQPEEQLLGEEEISEVELTGEEAIVPQTLEVAAAGTPAEAIEEEAPKALAANTVIAMEASVRGEPDGMSPVIATVAEGTELTVLEVSADWIKVELDDGTIGYIYRKETSIPAPEKEKSADEEAAEIESEEVEMKVLIFTSRKARMTLGETVYLTSDLQGFENCTTIAYQWQWDTGSGFEDIPGATEDSYSFSADLDTLSYDWRLKVDAE